MSALIDHLEARGYVERVTDPDDARATRVRRTVRGRAYARAVRAFGREMEKDWARRVGAKRMEELRATLTLLNESLRSDEG
jgi:DNA-binding MarR family transcriptional regulator